MASPPAWVSAFGQWATQVVPYTLTQGMVPVQDQSTGLLIGWVSPGQQISDLLSGQNGMLLPGESAAAQTLLQNLTPANNITIQLP